MDLITLKPVFNTDLEGEIVHIEGIDTNGKLWNGSCFIKLVAQEHLFIRDHMGVSHALELADFEERLDYRPLTLKVLEK